MLDATWTPATNSEREALQRHPSGWQKIVSATPSAGRYAGQHCTLMQPNDNTSERRWVPNNRVDTRAA